MKFNYNKITTAEMIKDLRDAPQSGDGEFSLAVANRLEYLDQQLAIANRLYQAEQYRSGFDNVGEAA